MIRRLAMPAGVAYTLGVVLGWYLPAPSIVYLLSGLCCIWVLAELMDRIRPFAVHRLRVALTLACCLALAWTRVSARLTPPGSALSLPLSGRDQALPVRLVGTVQRGPVRQGDVQCLYIRPEWPGWSRGLVRLSFIDWTQPLPIVGDRVAVRCRLARPSQPSNPGEPSGARYFAAQGVYGLGWVREADALERLPEARRAALQGVTVQARRGLYGVRSTLSMMIAEELTPARSALLRGVLLGDRGSLRPEQRWAFQNSGLAHLMSVSGLHVTFVAGLPMAALGRLGSPRTLSYAIALAGATSYAVVVGLAPPVIRALIMLGVALLADLSGRGRNPARALGFAAGFLLLVDPLMLFDAGCQLSVAATGGIILALKLWSGCQAKSSLSKWSRGAVTCLVASVGAQLATLPLVVWHFNTVPLLSLVANLLAVPLATVAVQAGALGLLLGMARIPAGGCLVRVAGWSAGLLWQLARFLAETPFATLQVGRQGFAVATVSSLAVAAMLAWGASRRSGGSLPGVAGMTGLLAFAPLCLAGYLGVARLDRTLRVTFLAVGSASAVHIKLPGSRHVIVDTGRGNADDGWSANGDGVIVPYLKRLGVRRLDGIILTHNHTDHAGGLAGIRRLIETGWVAGGDSAPDRSWTAGKRGTGVAYRQVRGTEMIRGAHGASIAIRAPRGSTGESNAPAVGRGENAGSLTVIVRYGRFSLAVSGDRDPLWDPGRETPVTVLEVPHHGSRFSANTALLASMRPQVAVISVGPNGYGHPAAETLERLRRAGIRQYRTDRDGAVALITDGHKYRVVTVRRDDAYWPAATAGTAGRRRARFRDGARR